MPKFLVPITRDCTETTTWTVEADTVEEAVELALDKVRQFGQTGMMQWERDDCTNLERHVYFAGDTDYSAVQEVDDGPVATLCFRPQACLSDYIISVDPEGADTWEIPRSELLELFPTEDDFHSDHANRDALHYDRRAPKWVRDWSGPYEVELVAGDVWEND